MLTFTTKGAIHQGEPADLENIVAQRVKQVVRHDAYRVYARARPEHHSRAAELDCRVVYGVENSHVKLARIQKRF